MAAKGPARPKAKRQSASRTRLSEEVQLAWEVMTCLGLRTTYDRPDSPCHWFAKHYGPYPAYSLVQEQPLQLLEKGARRHLSTVSKGMRYAIPEVISGCRKAPIMSIGINPNLTAYQHSVRGSTWCYPYFDDIKKYGDHFRHRTINQERFLLPFIQQHIAKGTEVVARADGKVTKVSLGTDNVAIEVKYNSGGAGTVRVPLDYVVLYDQGEHQCTFHKGDVLAGKLALPEDEPVDVVQEPVGYYVQFHKILEMFKAMGDADLQRSDFQIGEDACQGDMCACPSPGWNAYFPDEVRQGIVQECVLKRRHLARQLAQTRPAVIVFVGSSSLQMFLDILKTMPKGTHAEIVPQPDLKLDTMQLLRDCAHGGFWLQWQGPGVSFKSRLIFSPHFSYPSNFTPGCWMTLAQWSDFKQQFPADAKALEDAKKMSEVFGTVHVHTTMKDKTWKELDAKARQSLKACWLDPGEAIASVMLDEYRHGRLQLDPSKKHLVRADGPCAFCNNELFQLPGGCRYGKSRAQEQEAR